MDQETFDKMIQMYQNTVGSMNHQIILLALTNDKLKLENEKITKEIAALKGEKYEFQKQ